MDTVSLRSALRDRTRGLHGRLDAAMTGPEGRVGDLPTYLRVVRTLHTMHAYVDRPLDHWAAASPLARDVPRELIPDRAAAYAADLRALGSEPALVTAPSAASGSSVPDARGLALLYLVAGSSIGARVVLAGLPAAVPAEARRGLTDAADPSSTRLWRTTQTLLARPVRTELADAVTDEVCEVFELLLQQQELVAS